MIKTFETYLDKEKVKYTESDIHDNLTWINWKIRREVLTSVFGLNDGYKVELQNDPQVQRAIDLMPQARALYDNARKVLAERRSAEAVNR